ncbi:MAG: lysophospholipid acyltransferase family protein [Planctomycetota bacterium]|nr:lysophospholipid acyltransferase family protein [Planctomycetota bacterium]
MGAGPGVLLISGHLGSWEVGPYTMALLGRPIHFVHNPGTVAAVYEFLKRQRERSGMKVLARTDHPWALKKLLDRGAWLCIAGDVNAGRRGTFVPFCGVAASTYLTPAALQQTTGCPLVVATTARQPDGRHKVHVWRTFETPPPKDDPEALVRRTAEIHAGLEEAIRTYPEQWLWTYRRWRRRPEGETPDADGLPPRVNAV